MDTLSKLEIEEVLSSRLPNCTISCSINPDSSLSVDVIGPESHQFTIINIDRLQYHGDAGINRLVREILEEMVISRQSSNL
ncbi:hypothetical protein PS726_00091 [Pseudomonas fluorescens]|uniref:DUF1652 domain-containing protein n=1 Tax=Pseudomonas fluorescens TaxID=294 RepID=A0A8H2NUJ3_PSEFL|nr:hypothetical protein [Pseudomonas fluorescens]VVN65931.1 hypothetical protein PS726_00091 [Pseudomonas fluorescens]VVP21631.1 hypothetical protein PS900_03883 [Pseudomonas fluorescens]